MNEPEVGQPFRIERGWMVHSLRTGKVAPALRSQTVVPYFVDHHDDRTVVTWAGAGGYWRRVTIGPLGVAHGHLPTRPSLVRSEP